MYKFIRPVLFKKDPEEMHDRMARLGNWLGNSPLKLPIQQLYSSGHSSLHTSVFGLDFPNPVGLAAGYDKHAWMVDFLPALGFGFLEVGTVTPRPQPGNDKPRLFRIEQDEAVINRMGFNNHGIDALRKQLGQRRGKDILGGNIGINKDTPHEKAVEDYEKCFLGVYDLVDYFVVNVSSPNTPGLRQLQEKEPLMAILSHLQKLNTERKSKPVLLKIAPDLTDGQLEDIVDVVKQAGIAGIIATNTTMSRDGLSLSTDEIEKIGMGGLSGKPVRNMSTAVIRKLYSLSGGAVPIVGVGGIFSAEDAYEKICAGASLVQLYTGLIYEGPGLVKRVKEGLVQLLARDGFSSVQEAVGSKNR